MASLGVAYPDPLQELLVKDKLLLLFSLSIIIIILSAMLAYLKRLFVEVRMEARNELRRK